MRVRPQVARLDGTVVEFTDGSRETNRFLARLGLGTVGGFALPSEYQVV